MRPLWSSVTLAQSVYKLRRMAEILAPHAAFGWLTEIEQDLAFVAQPQARFDRTVTTEVLVEAGERGYRTMRLFTPIAQARALRFYERESWTLTRSPVEPAPGFGMPLAELRRAINSSV